MSSSKTIGPKTLAPKTLAAGVLGTLGLLACHARAQVNPAAMPGQDPATSITERLAAQLPPGLTYRDEQGQTVSLGSFFDGKKPVLLNLGYFGCPALCGAVANGLVDGLKATELEPGKDFTIVTLSIDPKEGPDLARDKKAAYLQAYGRDGARAHWHFLTGEEPEIRALARAVGFGYEFDRGTQQYLHGAAIMFLSPEGKLTRYLYGTEFKPRDLRFALVESGEGRVGTTWDRILLNCYGYDPRTRSYALLAWSVMRIGGVLTVAAVAALILFHVRRERRAIRAKQLAPAVT